SSDRSQNNRQLLSAFERERVAERSFRRDIAVSYKQCRQRQITLLVLANHFDHLGGNRELEFNRSHSARIERHALNIVNVDTQLPDTICLSPACAVLARAL